MGLWAANFVQTPVPQYCPSSPGANSPFDSPYIDHVMVALATIILPIRERAAFLEQVSLVSITFVLSYLSFGLFLTSSVFIPTIFYL